MSVKRGLPAAKKMRHDRHYIETLSSRSNSLIVEELPIEKVRPNPDQPRKDLGDLSGLAGSIEEQGILEPILVNQVSDGYIIISGERRFQASRLLKRPTVPCLVKNLNEEQTLEVALVENLQRKDLHPFEEADGLKGLHDSFGYTHEMIARKIGKSRSSVTETINLSSMSSVVRQAALDGGIRAKSMLLQVAKLDTVEEQLELIAKIAKGADRATVRKQTKKQQRAQPFVFKFKNPDASYSFNLKFKKSEVSSGELISTLENILEQLKKDAEAQSESE